MLAYLSDALRRPLTPRRRRPPQITREIVRGGRPRDMISDGACDAMSDDNLLSLVDE